MLKYAVSKQAFRSLLKGTTLPLIISSLFLMNAQRAQAQYYDEYDKLVGGLLGGFTSSQVDGDGYKGYNKLGWTGGGILYMPFSGLNLPIEGTMAISMEVLFTQKGAFGRTLSNGIYGQDISLSYAEIPIQLHYWRGARKSHIGAGFALGYLGWAQETVDLGAGDVKLNDYPFKKFDLSFIFTPSIHLYKGLFIAPRFQASLMSIRDDAGPYGRNQQFNKSLSVRLMYLIGNK